MTRDKLEALVWKLTHKDYRGTTEGVRYVLHLSDRYGTTSVPLSSLTELQLRDKLPRAVREEHFGPDPRTNEERGRHYNALASELGHIPLKQGRSFECPRCGASGSFTLDYAITPPLTIAATGPIFTDRCGSKE